VLAVLFSLLLTPLSHHSLKRFFQNDSVGRPPKTLYSSSELKLPPPLQALIVALLPLAFAWLFFCIARLRLSRLQLEATRQNCGYQFRLFNFCGPISRRGRPQFEERFSGQHLRDVFQATGALNFAVVQPADSPGAGLQGGPNRAN